MRNVQEIWEIVEAKRAAYEALADRVFDTPELLYREVESARAHEDALRAEGFAVTAGLAGIPTAVMGEAGDGGPVVAILGEYDALPGLSQEPGVAEHRPLVEGGAGHGCGHNLLGAAAMLAAAAVRDALAAKGLPGRVRYLGCPAEEGGAAKAFMVRAGLFEDVDAAITWHPAAFNEVARPQALANTRIDFTFHGRAAHAAGAPHLGRSALDAVELMSVGCNYLREHMPSDARIHYAYLDAGGIAPNVVQARAKVRYAVRTGTRSEMPGLLARVRAVAEGAALMTGAEVSSRVLSAVSDLLGNGPLERAMQAEMDRLGPVPFDEADRAFARAIRATLGPEHTASAYAKVGLPVDPEAAMHEGVVPLEAVGKPMIGSTDVGDVSWVVPTVQAHVATCAIGTPAHSWQLTAQGKTPAAHKGLVHAAKVMAATALRAIEDGGLLAEAKADLARRTAADPYASPLPPEVEPPLDMADAR